MKNYLPIKSYSPVLRLSIFIISLLIISSFFGTINLTTSKRCGFEYLSQSKSHTQLQVKLAGESIFPNKRSRSLLKHDYKNLRIHLDYSQIERSLDKFSNEDLEALRTKIMPKAAEIYEKILKIKPFNQRLKFKATKCDDFELPEKYQSHGEGVNADLIIFVGLDPSDSFKKNDIEAAAIHCLQHATTKRPLAGYIQFRPDIDVKNQTNIEYLIWLAFHEMTHILLMNDALYKDFINPYDNKLIGIENVLAKSVHPISKQSISVIKSPLVVAKARKHFNCDTLEGVPLEYNGGVGTVGAHWSKKAMNTDYMIGDSYGENLISGITLALFEDSGWYKPEYSKANLYLWGKDQGCGFFANKCVSDDVKNARISGNSTNNDKQRLFADVSKENSKERKGIIKETSIPKNSKQRRLSLRKNSKSAIPKLIFSASPDEFCNKPNKEICSRHHIFRGVCSVKEYKSELPEYLQYFSNRYLAGVDSLIDRCPIAIENKRGQYQYGGSCRLGVQSGNEYEEIGADSACFINNLVKDSQEDKEDIKAGCFKFSCSSKKDIEVHVKGKKYTCDVNGKISIDGYKGEIQCPSKEILCDDKYKCKFGCEDANKI